MRKRIKNFISWIEDNRHINWKVIALLYLLTRVSIVLVLNYGVWNNMSMLCYTADCKHWWNNAKHVAEGRNPYEEWRKIGFLDADIPYRSDYPPFLYILLSIAVILWDNIWAIRSMFFLFDFLNLLLIWNLSAKFKKISVLLYIFAPSILRGVFFPEDELFVTFVLLSIYFLGRKKYSLSTIMLAFSFNVKIFPILLFPLLLLNMKVFEKVEGRVIPRIENFPRMIKQTSIFIFTSILLHLPYFPDWYMAYEFRTIAYALAPSNRGLWFVLPPWLTKYYFIIVAFSFVIFYIYSYLKNLDIKTNYLFGSLLFISLFPGFSTDHLIFIIPLFLIWTEFKLEDILLFLFLSMGVVLEFLGLRTIGVISQYQRKFIIFLVLISFYIRMINYLKQQPTDLEKEMR